MEYKQCINSMKYLYICIREISIFCLSGNQEQRSEATGLYFKPVEKFRKQQ